MNKTLAMAAIVLIGLSGTTFAGETPAPANARPYFANLVDGAIVSGSVKIIFGLSGMGVAPAGIDKANTGHHHILIDRPPLGQGEEGADEFDGNIPADEHHKHFGGGQTEVTLKLAPGTHSLQLVLGDKDHIPHNPPIVSDRISIIVK